MSSSNQPNLLLYIFATISVTLTLLAALLGYFSGSNAGELFRQSVGNISDKYYTEVTPSSFVFVTIWPIIFLWTISGSLYLFISLFLSEQRSPLKTDPPIVPPGYFYAYTISFAFTNGWYFAFDYEKLFLSFSLLVLMTIHAYSAIQITAISICNNETHFERKYKVSLWLVRGLVQNGLCVFATWITIATMLNLTIVLVYEVSSEEAEAELKGFISVETGSTVSLVILLVLVLLWFCLENFVWEKYFRYIFTVYPVFIFAFSGLVVALKSADVGRNLTLALVNLGIASFLFFVRIILSVDRIYLQKLAVVKPKLDTEKCGSDDENK